MRRLGHEPVASRGLREEARGADAIVLEPGDEGALALGRWARANAPGVPIVCASIFPPGPESDALRPDAYLVKPFPLFRLEHALALALERAAADHRTALRSV